jgi:hypothetical protein
LFRPGPGSRVLLSSRHCGASSVEALHRLSIGPPYRLPVLRSVAKLFMEGLPLYLSSASSPSNVELAVRSTPASSTSVSSISKASLGSIEYLEYLDRSSRRASTESSLLYPMAVGTRCSGIESAAAAGGSFDFALLFFDLLLRLPDVLLDVFPDLSAASRLRLRRRWCGEDLDDVRFLFTLLLLL